MKPVLLSLLNTTEHDIKSLSPYYEVITIKNQDEGLALPQETLNRVEALFGSATRNVSIEFLDALPNLKVISSFGVGFDPYDEAYITSRKIRLGYTPDVLNDCVADLAFALLLDCARQVSASDRYVRAGRWVTEGIFPLGVQVSGKRLGIVGLGRIGIEIAERAKGFRMEILYHNRNPRTDVPYRYVDSLIELAKQSDFLVVATPGGPDNAKLINQEVLEALGPEGYLINIARGVVVDEEALVSALQSRSIAGAGLDVFVNEPHVPEALFELDNVTLCPHIASATIETRGAMRDLAIENFVHFALNGEVKVAVPWANYSEK